MKLGILLDKELIRKDIIKLLVELKKDNELIVFCKGTLSHLDFPELEKVKIRPVLTRSSFLKNVSKFLYSYFGFLPKSINNYKVVTYFTFQKISNKYKRFYAERIYFPLLLSLPKFVSFDQYLTWISGHDVSDIQDVENFLLLTHINDVEFLSNLIEQNKNVKIYLYSWDHSCKLKHLPRHVDYLVWNTEVGKDLSLLNDIKETLIRVIGSTQLAILEEYKSTHARVGKGKYIYFGFSTGYLPLIQQEIAFVKVLSRILDEWKVDVKLCVRTYPMQKDHSVYDELKDLDNVEIENTVGIAALNDDEQIYRKFHSLESALAFFHFGTTLGLECCFFDTPSFIVDYPVSEGAENRWNISNFVHQYQNERYLLLKSYPNVLSSEEQLRAILKEILINNNSVEYLKYNYSIQETFSIKSMGQIAQYIVDSYK